MCVSEGEGRDRRYMYELGFRKDTRFFFSFSFFSFSSFLFFFFFFGTDGPR